MKNITKEYNEKEYDVIILGAGIVGLVFANLCAQQNLKVALVDPHLPVEWNKEKRDIRCSAISRRSQNILQSIGVWESIARNRISAYQRMEVWDALSEGEIHFDAREIAEANLGHIVENSLIVKCLWEKLLEKGTDAVACFVPGKPTQISRESGCVILQLDLQLEDKTLEEKLSAKLLVGADGGQSWLRQTAGIQTKGWDYQQNALVVMVETEVAHQETARQRFLKDGILAFLPLSDPHLSSIVWSTTKEQSDFLIKLDEKRFSEELAHAFDYRLGKVLHVGERRAFPLAMQHAVRYVDERIALLGDSAHVIHPLAGQGVNLGLYDAKALAELLNQARKGHDIGQLLFLRRYERTRRSHNLSMIASMEFFKQMFSAKTFPLQGLRGMGMNMINKSPFLKKKLIQQAMGSDV